MIRFDFVLPCNYYYHLSKEVVSTYVVCMGHTRLNIGDYQDMSLRFRLAAVMAVVLTACAGDAMSALFEPLFKISKVTGDVRIVKPGSDVPELALESHAYPYGSKVIVGKQSPKGKNPVKPEVHLVLSRDHQFKLYEGGELTISHGAEGDEAKKVLDLAAGRLGTFITISTVKTGGAEDAGVDAAINAVTVKTPLAECHKLTERNEITVADEGAFSKCVFATGGGLMEVAGPQYKISGMRRNSAVEIFGDKDFTRITNLVGEFIGEVDRGLDNKESVPFKTRCVVKIWRLYAEIGGRMAVSVMIAHPNGSINSYAYLDGEAAVADSSAVKDGQAIVIAEKKPEEGGTETLDTTALEGALPGVGAAGTTGEKTEGDGKVPAEGGLIDFNFDSW